MRSIMAQTAARASIYAKEITAIFAKLSRFHGHDLGDCRFKLVVREELTAIRV